MSERWVLDSSAVLVLLAGESGSEEIAEMLHQAEQAQARVMVPWVTMGEVAHIVETRWRRTQLIQVLGVVESTALELVPVERDLTLTAAHLKAEHGLAYVDAFAAALAQQEEATLVTNVDVFEGLEDIKVHRLGGGA